MFRGLFGAIGAYATLAGACAMVTELKACARHHGGARAGCQRAYEGVIDGTTSKRPRPQYGQHNHWSWATRRKKASTDSTTAG